jgi:hypothetical protein
MPVTGSGNLGVVVVVVSVSRRFSNVEGMVNDMLRGPTFTLERYGSGIAVEGMRYLISIYDEQMP